MFGMHKISTCASPQHAAQIKSLQIQVYVMQEELRNLRQWTHNLHKSQSVLHKKRQQKKKSHRHMAVQTDDVKREMLLDEIDSDADFECV